MDGQVNTQLNVRDDMQAKTIVPAVDASAVPEDAYVIDVRGLYEWRAGHAPKAVHIPVGEVDARIDDVPRDREVYVVCRAGGLSAKVTTVLNEAGRQAMNVDGGMLRWAEIGQPMISETGAKPLVASPHKPNISYEEFARIDLRVALITGAEFIKNSRRFVLLTVDLGDEQSQMVAAKGLPDFYPPHDLVGRRVIWMANLNPKKIAGHFSRGMILAAADDQTVGLVLGDPSSPPGSQVR